MIALLLNMDHGLTGSQYFNYVTRTGPTNLAENTSTC